ncbi:unnamed protein product [Boreogadus saida]
MSQQLDYCSPLWAGRPACLSSATHPQCSGPWVLNMSCCLLRPILHPGHEAMHQPVQAALLPLACSSLTKWSPAGPVPTPLRGNELP